MPARYREPSRRLASQLLAVACYASRQDESVMGLQAAFAARPGDALLKLKRAQSPALLQMSRSDMLLQPTREVYCGGPERSTHLLLQAWCAPFCLKLVLDSSTYVCSALTRTGLRVVGAKCSTDMCDTQHVNLQPHLGPVPLRILRMHMNRNGTQLKLSY